MKVIKKTGEKDQKYMERALELAAMGRGYTNPNPMVGAVIVKKGRIIGEGYHERCGEGHAEVNAFKNCTEDPSGATIYVTLEPCSHYGKTPPCADLIIEKKIARVVVGALDPNPLVAGRGIKRIQDAGIEVTTGLLAEESIKLNEVFMHYIKEKDPFVVLKTAMSIDGKIATTSGESQWITCEEARRHCHGLRHNYMGIMVGVGTVLADNPQLTCRLSGGKNPVRIVVDSKLRSPIDSKIFTCNESMRTIVATAAGNDEEKLKQLKEKGVEIIVCPGEDGRVDISKLFYEVGQMGIDSILVEGGATLADSVVRSGAVNKVIAYVAPIIIGGENAKTPVGGVGIGKLSDALKLEDVEVEKIGTDILVSGVVTCSQES